MDVRLEKEHFAILFDTYGELLTEKQREICSLYLNCDLSLGEIGEAMGVSRQAVCDTLARTEALLRRMEDNIGCVRRSLRTRKAVQQIQEAARQLPEDPTTSHLVRQILSAVGELEE